MTCWIEDELHLEEHAHPPTYPKGRRPCNVFCEDGTHTTVVFTSHLKARDESHTVGQFLTYHQDFIAVEARPAHEVRPDMYPDRKHYGPAPDGSERSVAWMVRFKGRTPSGHQSEVET